jgi:hypothetical protein
MSNKNIANVSTRTFTPIKVRVRLRQEQYTGVINKWICTIHGEKREVTMREVEWYCMSVEDAVHSFIESECKNSSDMEDKIFDIVTDLIREDITKNEAIDKLLSLHNDRLSLFQKNKLDLLNWAKSELKQETNTKLSKTMTPYRSDKIIFLRRIIDWLNNEA